MKRSDAPGSTIDTPHQLRCVIARLSPASPATDAFTARWREQRAEKGAQREQKQVWYCTQHEHWLGWLQGWNGPGAYGRKDHNRSAEFVYNHVVNPQMLIYLAEAAGIPTRLVKKAASSALACSTMSAMSAAIRREVPWPMIEKALSAASVPSPPQAGPQRAVDPKVLLRRWISAYRAEARADGYQSLMAREGRGDEEPPGRLQVEETVGLVATIVAYMSMDGQGERAARFLEKQVYQDYNSAARYVLEIHCNDTPSWPWLFVDDLGDIDLADLVGNRAHVGKSIHYIIIAHPRWTAFRRGEHLRLERAVDGDLRYDFDVSELEYKFERASHSLYVLF